MSASESEPEKQNTKHVERMAEELLRAKSKQRQLYLWFSLALGTTALFILAMIVFSKATMIQVEPKEARDHAVIELADGWGMMLGNAVYSLSEEPAIKVSAIGFKTRYKTIRSNEMGSMLSVELAALPAQLSIETHPSTKRTQWFIDGRLVMLGLKFKHEVTAGEHLLEIDNPYYQREKLQLILQRGEAFNLDVGLKDILGRLDISTRPAGADIYLNNEKVGVSPLSLPKNGGRYQLEIRHKDYQEITESIEITHSEKTIQRDYRLAVKQASLHIDVSPEGGELLLDGKAITPNVTLGVEARLKHSLSYTMPGYIRQYKQLSLKPKEKQKLSFHLKPELGKISIISSPRARVKIDGNDVGETPFKTSLQTTSHHIEIYKQGYRSYQRKVTPSAHSAKTIKVQLLTIFAAKVAEAPQKMKNSAGIELKLFQPNETFSMGAARSEIGQRANEFLRTVQLNLPFYISTHEITRAQYNRFKATSGPLNEPVTSISWIEAAQYCNWLSIHENITPFYNIQHGQLQGFNPTGDGYRLPSEAEWEWLARKAAKNKATRFTWGDSTTIPEKSGNIADEKAKGSVPRYIANYSDGYAGIAAVGSYPAEPMGLYDMSGNVSEWVHDVYLLIPPGKDRLEINPMGAKRGDTHTVKGSNWRSGSITELRASYREGEKIGRDDIGFRVVRYLYGGDNAQ